MSRNTDHRSYRMKDFTLESSHFGKATMLTVKKQLSTSSQCSAVGKRATNITGTWSRKQVISPFSCGVTSPSDTASTVLLTTTQEGC